MSVLRKLVPAPILSAALLALWLMLARDAGAGQLLLGALLALAVPRLTASLRPTRIRVRRPRVIARYVLTVAGDVVRSNLAVARGVLRLGGRRPASRFVRVPLELRDPLGLAALALVTTIVPGTVWSELAVDGSALLLHAWDVDEDEAFVQRFKARYERPLREIFE